MSEPTPPVYPVVVALQAFAAALQAALVGDGKPFRTFGRELPNWQTLPALPAVTIWVSLMTRKGTTWTISLQVDIIGESGANLDDNLQVLVAEFMAALNAIQAAGTAALVDQPKFTPCGVPLGGGLFQRMGMSGTLRLEMEDPLKR